MRLSRYSLPSFLEQKVTQSQYFQWLSRKARAHVKRDTRDGNQSAEFGAYRDAIHQAVVQSQGRDAYTGELLAWNLIGKFRNEDARRLGRGVIREYALLPTVDHLADRRAGTGFAICGLRINTVKSCLTLAELRAVCRQLLLHEAQGQ